MRILHATAAFFPLGRWSLPNPYLEMMIGDPKAGAVYRCVLDLDGAEAIEPGACGPVTATMVFDLVPDWAEPWPLWHGQVIGELTSITEPARLTQRPSGLGR